jgi:TPP-dependent 2-oxoacid decarboxylase
MIKVSDYIARRLADQGVRHVFMITGGGAMHLSDSFGSEERIQYVCCHHEQVCAIAAEGCARTLGQWLDSMPSLGQTFALRESIARILTWYPRDAMTRRLPKDA